MSRTRRTHRRPKARSTRRCDVLLLPAAALALAFAFAFAFAATVLTGPPRESSATKTSSAQVGRQASRSVFTLGVLITTTHATPRDPVHVIRAG